MGVTSRREAIFNCKSPKLGQRKQKQLELTSQKRHWRSPTFLGGSFLHLKASSEFTTKYVGILHQAEILNLMRGHP